MRTYAASIAPFEVAPNREPRFVVQLSWDNADTDYTYLTSSSEAAVPVTSPAVEPIHNSVLSISGQSQRINPDLATSTIGSVNLKLLDGSNDVTRTIATIQAGADGIVNMLESHGLQVGDPVVLSGTSCSPTANGTHTVKSVTDADTFTIELTISSGGGGGSAAYTLPRALTTKMSEKLLAGDGLRGKLVRVYVGYADLPFTDYDLRLTYIVDSISYQDNVYNLTISDLQRSERKKIFSPDETTLNSSITADALVVPVTTSDVTKFPTITHGAEWDTRPSQTLAYIKIDKEVMAHTGLSFDTVNGYHFTIIERGALNTTKVEHNVGDNITEDSKKPKIKEHVFIEGPAPKVLYALLTGQLLNGASPEDTLPDHWHLGIDTTLVRLTDLQNIGIDYWDTSTDAGRFVRIENPGSQDGKRFIEKEILLWMGCFMPIYSTGELGLKRIQGVLSDASYTYALNKNHIKSYSAVTHDMRSVMNDIHVQWNFVDSRDDYTKDSYFIDAVSIAKHNSTDRKTYKFNAVHSGLHTDEQLFAYFDVLRDRYSGPPLLLTLELMATLGGFEVGDIVKVSLDQIKDMNTGVTIDRAFEVQQVTTDWTTGNVSVRLFGSSQKAGTLARTTLSSVMEDSWYISEGTSLDSSDSPAGPLTIVADHVTANGTITGHATDNTNSTAIYYYDGSLTIDAGVVVTVEENVQLRIKGTLLINGSIQGIGTGATGGAATTTYTAGVTTFTRSETDVGQLVSATDEGEQGYFGTPIGSDMWWVNAVSSPTLYVHNTYLFGVPLPYVIVPTTLATRNEQVRAAIVHDGRVTSVPYYDITNPDGLSISGWPKDLRGNAGGGGLLLSQVAASSASPPVFFDRETTKLANGGAGGDGGAGLIIIARTVAFGTDGYIDLSGGDSSAGSSAVVGGKTLWAPSGAPGAPGALVILLDGQSTNPDITNDKFVANFGSVTYNGGATQVTTELMLEQSSGYHNITNWPWASAVLAGDDRDGTNGDNAWESAFRLQYLPPAENPVTDDSSFPDIVRGLYKELSRVSHPTPGAGKKFGTAFDVTEDGTRFVVYDQAGAGTGTYNVHIYRGVANPVLEQTINDPDNGWDSFWTRISEDGDRILVSAYLYNSGGGFEGACYIYSRSGVTWTLEQRIVSAAPVGGDFFGYYPAIDGGFTHVILTRANGTNDEMQYWSRSGTTWSLQGTLPDPATVGSTFAHTMHNMMAHDGEYFIIGDTLSAEGGTNAGGAHVYQRTGSSWAVVGDTLIPDATTLQWGRYVACNADGTAFAITNAASAGGAESIAIYYRQSTTFKLIQIIVPDAVSPTQDIRYPRFSRNGLTLSVYRYSTLEMLVYKRASLEQPFKLVQTIYNTDAGSWGSSNYSQMSDDASFYMYGNPLATDGGFALSGLVHIVQYTPDAEK